MNIIGPDVPVFGADDVAACNQYLIDAWPARMAPMGADASQLFLFEHRDKWTPGGPPPGPQRVAVDR